MHGRHEWFLHAREGLTGWRRGARYRDATAGSRQRRYASRWHFCMKLFFAAPTSGRPSLPTAFAWHVSRLHFFKKLALAAPASGLPSLLTALLSQVSCANAKVKFSESTNAASKIR
jgi:hypothetical protein